MSTLTIQLPESLMRRIEALSPRERRLGRSAAWRDSLHPVQ
jgi:metal-responsive CopG/Arc/MetJ family transcriptional regulator